MLTLNFGTYGQNGSVKQIFKVCHVIAERVLLKNKETFKPHNSALLLHQWYDLHTLGIFAEENFVSIDGGIPKNGKHCGGCSYENTKDLSSDP